MPEIDFRCPHCSEPLKATDDMVGQTIDCPACSKSLTIPSSPATKRAAKTPQEKKKMIIMGLVLLFLVYLVIKMYLPDKEKEEDKQEQVVNDKKQAAPKPKKKPKKKVVEVEKEPEPEPAPLVEKGFTRKQVIKLRGAPTAKIQKGKKEILFYDDSEIELINGVVSDIQ